MGYSTQIGYFSQLDNAVRLERLLEARGIDAYYFRHESGLYKVRFGNHDSYRAAQAEAERLRAQGLIGEFLIFIPEDYAVDRTRGGNPDALRAELVRTARRFLGVLYRWGGHRPRGRLRLQRPDHGLLPPQRPQPAPRLPQPV